MNEIKQVELEGWSSEPVLNYPSYVPPPVYPSSNQKFSNILSRFSPIVTDEEDNNVENETKKKNSEKDDEVDLASNILNSLADIDFKEPNFSSLQNKPYEQTDIMS